MSAEIVLLVVVASLLVVAALLAAYLTAHRLDRLHIRTDLARSSLVGALGRRHVVAASVVRELAVARPEVSGQVARALDHARAHPPHAVLLDDPAPVPDAARRRGSEGARRRGDRPVPVRPEQVDPDAEHAENALGLVLAGVPAEVLSAELAAEVEDASDRVSMARRFYNDAVRDTRALREKGLVRALRLAGHAPLPDFVELVDPPTA